MGWRSTGDGRVLPSPVDGAPGGHDEATGRSELAIIDATGVTAGPIASVELPARVPYGFHAAWVPAS